ncbi:M-phase phosphoprotein 6 [Sminthopsis crassicaudata]|uniref:M-phase phosphoprotein 6 n=1 Tax=Sminthopsis crassicaudata TaxID=9301 RepID=UPI003D68E436
MNDILGVVEGIGRIVGPLTPFGVSRLISGSFPLPSPPEAGNPRGPFWEGVAAGGWCRGSKRRVPENARPANIRAGPGPLSGRPGPTCAARVGAAQSHQRNGKSRSLRFHFSGCAGASKGSAPVPAPTPSRRPPARESDVGRSDADRIAPPSFRVCFKEEASGGAMAATSKPKLSKNLLRMKFMQRGLDAETKKQLEEEEKKIISEEHWYLDLPELKEKESFIIEEQSFMLCEDLLYGRMSFRGFNPEIEKIMVQMNSKQKDEEVEDVSMEADVSEEEMARRYESLVGTIGKKFAKKRDRAQYDEDENGNIKSVKTKKTFLKPQD